MFVGFGIDHMAVIFASLCFWGFMAGSSPAEHTAGSRSMRNAPNIFSFMEKSGF